MTMVNGRIVLQTVAVEQGLGTGHVLTLLPSLAELAVMENLRNPKNATPTCVREMESGLHGKVGQAVLLSVVEDFKPERDPAPTLLQLLAELTVLVKQRNLKNATLTLVQVYK